MATTLKEIHDVWAEIARLEKSHKRKDREELKRVLEKKDELFAGLYITAHILDSFLKPDSNDLYTMDPAYLWSALKQLIDIKKYMIDNNIPEGSQASEDKFKEFLDNSLELLDFFSCCQMLSYIFEKKGISDEPDKFLARLFNFIIVKSGNKEIIKEIEEIEALEQK